MQRTVIRYGLLAGLTLAFFLAISAPFADSIGSVAEYLGYASMVVAFLFVYFGVRAYRDDVGAGSIGFGRAFSVGLVIALIASVCYVITWEILLHTVFPDFASKYAAQAIANARAAGASPAALAATTKRMDDFRRMYANPLLRMGMTLLEPLPMGLLLALVSAAVLRRRQPEAQVAAA